MAMSPSTFTSNKPSSPAPSAPQTLTSAVLPTAGAVQPISVPPNQNNPAAPSIISSHNYRPLNVRDALSYLDQVKLQFQELPGVYNQFLDIMKDFKTQTIDTPGVIDGVSSLFRGHPALIQGFNTFLPPGYRIDVSQGEASTHAGSNSAYNLITVTHPMGVQTQKRVPLQSGGEEIGSHIIPDTTAAHPSTGVSSVNSMSSADKLTRDNVNSLALNPLPRTMIPNGVEASASTSAASLVSGPKTKPVTLDVIATHGLGTVRTNSPALSNTASTDASKSTVKPLEFNHAITYVNKIKNRYSSDPKTYQTFLDILQTYQRDAKPIQEVYEQVNHLFREEPDLMVEFMQFLPDTSGNTNPQPLSNSEGLLGVCNSAGATSHDDAKNSSLQSNPKQSNSGTVSQQPIPKRKRNGANVATNTKAAISGGARTAVLEANKARNASSDSNKVDTAVSIDQNTPRGTKRKPKGVVNPGGDAATPATSTAGLPPPGFAPPGYRSIGEAYNATLTSNRALVRETRQPREAPQNLVNGKARNPVNKESLTPDRIPKRVIAKEELLFFYHVKTYFGDQTTYIEFLKIINLFTQDLIDLNTLVCKIGPFLVNCPELFNRFTDIVGWREDQSMLPMKRKGEANGLPEPKKARCHPTLNTRPVLSGSEDPPECGPSYRQVPESDVSLACSGRDALCSAVLNDRWVCAPPGHSIDEQLFTPRQTNSFERALYQAEDERHEYDYHIEANVRTIALLEPINLRIQQMEPEHRAEYRLKPGLGGQSKSIYQRIIKKIYGKEHGPEVIQALHENPALAVPIVLARLKQKDEEWKKALRDWNRVWREVDGKNYWKALDHQGISFKAVDKKMLGNKNLVNEIELIKREQQQKRQLALDPSIIQLLPKYQLELDLSDTDVFYDVLKILIHFLDHVPNSAGLDDSHKDHIESFLKSTAKVTRRSVLMEMSVIELEVRRKTRLEMKTNPNLRMVDPIDLPMRQAERGEVPKMDIRALARRSEASRHKGTTPSHSRTATEEPSSTLPPVSLPGANPGADAPDYDVPDAPDQIQTSSVRDEGPEPTQGNIMDVLSSFTSSTHSSLRPPPINEGEGEKPCNPISDEPQASTQRPMNHRPINPPPKQRRYNFFTNNAFYCFFRLLHIMYTRFYTLKKVSENIHMCPTPTSYPSSSSSSSTSVKSKFETYLNLLTCIQNLNCGQLDQSSFEDECRNLFGVKGYSVITIDKLCQALVKVLAKLSNDGTSQEILRLYETNKQLDRTSRAGGLTEAQRLAYRRSVEALTGGTDTKLFRMEWLSHLQAMRIQLVGGDDISPEDYEAVEKAWSSYIESYADMSVDRTIGLGNYEIKPAFLKRNVHSVRKSIGKIDPKMFLTQPGLGVRVCMRSYKLFFSPNTSDLLFRKSIKSHQGKRIEGEQIDGEKEDGEVDEVKSLNIDEERIKRWEKWLTLKTSKST
ncbi:uncharacterized protein MELLADRAFT_94093 [Melampsora larici-populina 98AG31]|uniref:Histone deacetylase interacting domain-containing protein n=1 Tax=Melampsora larici-populina (strain 98AG31 / pathotype 3-4-7) TaxID=747676 RepID=F4S6D6_MELLP|nr:uncharacterized protein MELLADRAFT_94093 [Melampsora larici-populina 98AG31]EGF99814.1 hypothetical protein MELLADRAFT_94093 [Melampsora larici-populina 98AG31]